jgi:3',5'-cyclic-AMP phosphodiesterase
MNQLISWIHFGDLHITGRDEQNYRDFLALIEEANRYMRSSIAFALLPGDNADDGDDAEYQLVKEALATCQFPVHAISGDHDVAAGNLDLFRSYLADLPYRSFHIAGYRFLLLNSVAHWRPPVFGLGDQQMNWLREELRLARTSQQHVVVFIHAYPSEHGTDALELRQLFHSHNVSLVEMGHTHYNELASDGRTIYAATRSTGQIEEGPVGFSVTTLDQGVISWKFKPLGEWPLVMVTSPADERLIVDPSSPSQVVRGSVQVRARVWGQSTETVTVSVDGTDPTPMQPLDSVTWGALWNTEQVADGSHVLTVSMQNSSDSIFIYVNQAGDYAPPPRREPDYENAIGAWPEKHILGTQLGPNENGHPW